MGRYLKDKRNNVKNLDLSSDLPVDDELQWSLMKHLEYLF